MEYSLEKIAEIAQTYGELRVAEANLRHSPNFDYSLKQARKLVNEIIPTYREKIPREIQTILNVDLYSIQRTCENKIEVIESGR